MELIVKNLSKRFGEKLILDQLSLSIDSGSSFLWWGVPAPAKARSCA